MIAIGRRGFALSVLAMAGAGCTSGRGSTGVAAPSRPAAIAQAPARFDWFDYRGDDAVFAQPVAADEYRNPIIAGFYPDPSIVRVGDDYYLVQSTFGYYPGLPIWHSRDLVNWTQIGNAIDRPGMIDLAGRHLGKQGLYAPTIRYHDGRFVIANTCVECGGNFVVTATNPAGPWSDPIWVKGVGGIDPQIYFEGKRAWMVNHDDPAGPVLYPGHKAIWIREIDSQTFQLIGSARMIVNGGVNIADRPGYVEGPHVFKRDGWYYLSAAEGGTGTDHRQVVWRSRQVMGPYQTDPGNPILTQRDLPVDRPRPITSTGHADMVETQNGEWWAVFLGTRTYDQVQFNTGRETFMLPVTWRDGWPVILNHGEQVPYVAKGPSLPRQAPPTVPTTGNFTVREEFDGALAPYWLFVRVPQTRWYGVDGGALTITPRPDRLGDVGQPSIVARRIQHMHAIATTRLQFDPTTSRAEAGLVALQNDAFYYAFGLTRDAGGHPSLVLRRRAGMDEPAHGRTLASKAVALGADAPIELRAEIDGPTILFSYSLDGRTFQSIAGPQRADILSTMRADGFNGATIGMYAEAE